MKKLHYFYIHQSNDEYRGQNLDSVINNIIAIYVNTNRINSFHATVIAWSPIIINNFKIINIMTYTFNKTKNTVGSTFIITNSIIKHLNMIII